MTGRGTDRVSSSSGELGTWNLSLDFRVFGLLPQPGMEVLLDTCAQRRVASLLLLILLAVKAAGQFNL